MFKRIENIKKNKIEAGEKESIQIMLGPDEVPNFAMRKFTIEVGGSIPMHTNTLEHEQYVLRGKGKIILGDETKEVSPGSIVFMPEGVPHSYDNICEEPFEFLCMVPNKKDEFYIIKQL